MRIGDLVLYRGELYYLRGLDPMSVPERRVQLEHATSQKLVVAPFNEVEDVPRANGSAPPA